MPYTHRGTVEHAAQESTSGSDGLNARKVRAGIGLEPARYGLSMQPTQLQSSEPDDEEEYDKLRFVCCSVCTSTLLIISPDDMKTSRL